jgi:methionyl-tRNA synthetase
MINYETFKQVEIRAGKILSAEKVPETDKLLRLSVDFAEAAPRTIVSGIAPHFPDPQALVGLTVMFVANLEHRVIKGIESQGMILAVSTPEGGFSLLQPNLSIPPGSLAA